jgi:hypothetical protein
MPVQRRKAPGRSATPDPGDELLQSRMVVIGLFSGAVARDDGAGFGELNRRCVACDCRGPCEADLRRDPANPVWQAYCPNAEAFTALLAR